MTVSELYSHVAQLGFEESLESDSRFYFALERALFQVNTLRPAIKVIEINHNPISNMLGTNFKAQNKINDLYYSAERGVAYYFEADGEGIAYIEMYDDVQKKWRMIDQINWKSELGFVSKKGFIKSDGEFFNSPVRLHFTGQYVYSVKNVAIYGELRSSQEEKIPPYSRFITYDMGDLVSDFIEFANPPISSEDNKTLSTDYFVESNQKICLSNTLAGIFKISYKSKPNLPTFAENVQEDKTVIDLDDELCSLLPNLVASYVWADDEPQKAEYYLSLYRERAAIIEVKKTDVTPVLVINKNGW